MYVHIIMSTDDRDECLIYSMKSIAFSAAEEVTSQANLANVCGVH